MYTDISHRVLVLNWLYNSVADFRDLPKRWHRDLAKVLAHGDPQLADGKMREHVRYALDDVLRRNSQQLCEALTP